MSSVLDKIIIKLNRNWQAFELLTVRKAITMLCGENDGHKPGYAMDFVTTMDENGEPMLQYANPVSWDVWTTLPVRDGDFAIETSRGPIRCPLVVICASYSKLPMRKPKLGNDAILKRDDYTCQYTKEKLPRHLLNIDHVIPLDRGGLNTWGNMVASRKDINFSKGNRLNSEVGLTLARVPEEPKGRPAVIRVDDLPTGLRDVLTPFALK